MILQSGNEGVERVEQRRNSTECIEAFPLWAIRFSPAYDPLKYVPQNCHSEVEYLANDL